MKNLKKQKIPFLKTKPVTTFFAIISLIGGGFFLSKGLTGNIVLTNQTTSPTTLGLIGLLLIACSITLALYTVVKKD